MSDEAIESSRYNIADNIKERFYQLPKGLFLYPRYRGLDPQAKIMYSILRDRLQLSKINNWVDEKGDIYLVFSQEKLSDLMGFSQSAVSKTMKKLEEAGLLEKSRTGIHSLQRIYINKLIVPDQSEILDDVSESNLIPNDNREKLEASLQKLKEQDALIKKQKDKDNNQNIKTFPEEYMESQIQTSKHSCGNIGETLENTKTFPEEYMESQIQTSKHSCGNIHTFPQEYPDIPTGISKYSSRNTNDTIYNKTIFNDTNTNDNIHTYNGSAAEKNESRFVKIEKAVNENIYGGNMPIEIKEAILDAIKAYGEEMVEKAVEKTRKFHKHHFAYTQKILESWQQEIQDGNSEPWVLPKGCSRSYPSVLKVSSSNSSLPKDLDEWERSQEFPWEQSS